MKKRRIATIGSLLTIILFFGLTLTAYSQDVKSGKVEITTSSLKSANNDVINVTLEGKNICLACTLKKEQGAAADCKTYGHRHTLKVEKAYDENGNELKGMEGWVLHYLENDKSEKYITGHHNDILKIKGKVYKNERVLEIEKAES